MSALENTNISSSEWNAAHPEKCKEYIERRNKQQREYRKRRSEKDPTYIERCNAQVKECKQRNLQAYKDKARDNMRENYIMVNKDGKRHWVKVEGKRARPDNCEICKRAADRLVYHHWDNNNILLGMWLCNPCHIMAEGVEKGRAEVYLMLKGQINKVFKPNQTGGGIGR